MPEIAAMGALERLDVMLNDALYGGGPCGVALGGGYNSLINTDLGGLYGKTESAGV